MSNLILLIILCSFLECAYKKIPIYEEFITGVKEGMHYLMILFPSIMLLTLWVNLFLSSGFISLIGTFFIRFFSIPLDLLLMAFTRPISSQTSLIILKRIYDHYGIDHLYSLMGSILQTGSDTTLYVVSLYYGSIHLKKYSYTLWLGFFLDFLSFVFMLCFYYLGMIS